MAAAGLIATLATAVALASSHAATRSHTARAEFQRAVPCPATGLPRGGCPGYVIDHVTPLCAGGADAAANMQWQTVDDAKAKDREEVTMCRGKR